MRNRAERNVLDGVGFAETVVFPHFADGGGWTTKIVLINEAGPAPSSGLLFPHLANGDAYNPVRSPQPVAEQSSAGLLRLLSQSGQPLGPILR